MATLTVEEVVGHLRAVEDRLNNDQGASDSGGHLLLTEKQWEEKKRQSRGQKGGKLSPSKPTLAPGPGGKIERDKCRYCGKKGHWQRECMKKQRDEATGATSNLTEAQEDSVPGLHIFTVVDLSLTLPPRALPTLLHQARLRWLQGSRSSSRGARVSCSSEHRTTPTRTLFLLT
jgi:hypothetical protein